MGLSNGSSSSSSSSSLFRGRQQPRQVLRRHPHLSSLLPLVFWLACMLIVIVAVVFLPLSWTKMRPPTPTPFELDGRTGGYGEDDIVTNNHTTTSKSFQSQAQLGKAGKDTASDPINHRSHHGEGPPSATQLLQSQTIMSTSSPYHNWPLFSTDYKEMVRNLKIFVYPDAHPDPSGSPTSPYDSIFLPLADAGRNPKLGNYFSEHAFKVALLHSSLVTKRPEEANFFFMPFSINAMRNHPGLHAASSISDFVAQYTTRISSESTYWNASGGADHFYVCCHSIGREAASKHPALHNNAIQITCSSSYFQRLYITHKDIGLPQVWPRQHYPDQAACNPPDASRNILVFFAGRAQNSLIRQKILDAWSNDTSFAISTGGGSSLPYEEGFKRSKYCLHIKGYEVNTARVCDAVHHGCIPVIISNYYDLPFANVLDWNEFSIIVREGDYKLLKELLLSTSQQTYQRLYKNLCLVRRHFAWHTTPTSYDAFYMTAYQLWLRRGLTRTSKLSHL